MLRLPPLIPELRKTERRIWLLIFGGALLFIATVLVLAATHPDTPANQLITGGTIVVLLPSAVMVGAGVYLSATAWRCPGCGLYLPTKFPVTVNCARCGTTLRA